jgi:hypothetical protein
MKLEINLSKDDFLQHQLYKASKRRTIKIQRLRNSIILSAFIIFLGIYAYIQTKYISFIFFFCVASVIEFLTYPLYLRILYKRHYSKFINENYKNKIENKFSLEILNGFIISKDSESKSELKIDIKEIKEIVEIKKNYFIVLDGISSVILPKNTETNDFINNIINNYNIGLNKELNWKLL